MNKLVYVIVQEIGGIILGLRVEQLKYIWTTNLDQCNRYTDLSEAESDYLFCLIELDTQHKQINSDIYISTEEEAANKWKMCYGLSLKIDTEYTTMYYDGKTVFFPIERDKRYTEPLFKNDLLLADLVRWETDLELLCRFYYRVKEKMKREGYLIFNIDRYHFMRLMNRCKRMWVICLD